MSPRTLILALTVLLLQTSGARALTVKDGDIRNPVIFGIEFPGSDRAFYGRADGVLSISKQKYVTPAFHVVEVNVVTSGKALLRIYHSRPLGPGEMNEAFNEAVSATGLQGVGLRPALPEGVQEAAERASRPVERLTNSTVIKEYPLATHAHTIEYRMRSEIELHELFEEMRTRWLREGGEGETRAQEREREEAEGAQRSQRRRLGGTLFIVEN